MDRAVAAVVEAAAAALATATATFHISLFSLPRTFACEDEPTPDELMRGPEPPNVIVLHTNVITHRNLTEFTLENGRTR